MFRRLGLSASSKLASPRDVLFWTSLVALVSAIKVTFLLFDRLPVFFLGDSESYLASAISPYMPFDRSFTYGLFFIRPILAIFSSLGAVIITQSLISGGSCILAGICMRVGFDAPLWVVAVTAIAYAFEPLALIQERLVLTETVALFFFALFVLVGLLYIRQLRWYLIVLLALIGTVELSLRTSFVPVVVIAAAAVVLLGAPRLWDELRARRRFFPVLLLHVVLAAGATAGFHAAYKQYFSYMTGTPPSYNAGGNFFLLAAWAPLVSKTDFPNERVANLILPKVKYDLRDRFSRPVNRFWPDGLVGVMIKAENGNVVLAQKLAGKVARNAVRRDPLGVAGLAWDTYADFWDRTIMDNRLLIEHGNRELSDNLIAYFKKHSNEDLSGHHLQPTLTKQWHLSAVYWYRFLLLSPLLSLFTILIASSHRGSSIFIGVTVCALIAVSCALVTESVIRYLHPVAWLTCLQLGQVLCVVPTLWRRPALVTAAS
jgi:hypothetical protein